MTCKDVREMIPLYYYGEMEGDRAEDVRAHLESCAGCRNELALVGRVLEKITAPQAPELPDEFWSRSASDIMRRVRRSRLAIPLWTAAAAAAAAVILAVFLVGTDPGRDHDTGGMREAASVPDDAAEETELAIEYLDAEIGDFWENTLAESSDETSGGFDSGFAEDLDSIEISIETLLMEFGEAGSWGAGGNGSV